MGAPFLTLLLLAAPASDWPQFLGPHRDGSTDAFDLLNPWPAEGPPRVWAKDIGQGFSGPVVAGGRVILFHRVDNQEVVAALDPTSGDELWSFAYRTRYRDDFGFDEGPRATPLVAEGKVYTLGAEGDLHALDLETGNKIWGRNIRVDYKAPKGFFGVAASPLLSGGRLLINVGAPGAGVVAFDPDTGEESWKATDDPASYSSPTEALIDGHHRAVFLTREGLVVLDPTTGDVSYTHPWRARLNASVNAATPLIRGQEIFLSSSYQTGAILFRVEDGQLTEIWSSDDSLSNHYNTSIEHDGFLYGIHGRQEEGAELRCVEWATGQVRWTKAGFGCASLIRVGEQLLALTESGELVLFSATPDAYREAARARVLDRPVRAAPALADGKLYARDERKLICLDLKE